MGCNEKRKNNRLKKRMLMEKVALRHGQKHLSWKATCWKYICCCWINMFIHFYQWNILRNLAWSYVVHNYQRTSWLWILKILSIIKRYCFYRRYFNKEMPPGETKWTFRSISLMPSWNGLDRDDKCFCLIRSHCCLNIVINE